MQENFMSIISFIGESSILTLIVITISFGVLSNFLREFIMEKRGGVKSSGKDKFFKALDKKYDFDLVKDRSDITILLDSIGRDEDEYYSLAPILEDYLKYLAMSSPDCKVAGAFDPLVATKIDPPLGNY